MADRIMTLKNPEQEWTMVEIPKTGFTWYQTLAIALGASFLALMVERLSPYINAL